MVLHSFWVLGEFRGLKGLASTLRNLFMAWFRSALQICRTIYKIALQNVKHRLPTFELRPFYQYSLSWPDRHIQGASKCLM